MSDDLTFARIASQFFGVPLLLRQPEAEVIANYLRARMMGAGPDANRFQGREEFDPRSQRWKGYRKDGAIGVVTITGELVNRGAWIGASSGLTSYEGIVQQVRNAAEDRDVRAIVLDIDSPGGAAFGMADAARQIRKIAAGKRLVAVVNSMAASAAYGLASAAHEIVVGESAIAGSIGVLLVHHDRSRQFDRAGISTVIVKAGDKKAVGNPYIALSDDDRAVLQAEVDRIMDGFVRVVSHHRPKLTPRAIRDLQAEVRLGEDAVKAGLADRVGTFDSVLSDLSRTYPAQVGQPRTAVTTSLVMSHSDRFRAVANDPRLASSPGLRNLALQAAGRAPAAKSAGEIVAETLAVFGREPSPAERTEYAAVMAARLAPPLAPPADPLAVVGHVGPASTDYSWSQIAASQPEAPGAVKSGGPAAPHPSHQHEVSR